MGSFRYIGDSDMEPVAEALLLPRSSFGTGQRCPLLTAFSKLRSRLCASANQIQGRNPPLAWWHACGRPLLERHNLVIRISDLLYLFLLLLVIHLAPDREISLRHLVDIVLYAIKTTLVVSLWLKRVPSRIVDDYQDSESSSRRKMAVPEMKDKDEQMLKVEPQPLLTTGKCPVPADRFKTHPARTQQSDVGMSSDVAMPLLTIGGVKSSKLLMSQILNDVSVQTPCILASCTDLNIPLDASYMPASDVHGISAEDDQGMTSEDDQGMTSEDVQGMTSGDDQGMTSEDVQGMTSGDVQGMTSGDVQGMTSEDDQGTISEDDQGVTSEDAQGITCDDVHRVTSDDIQGISENDLEETPTSKMIINQQERTPDHEGRTSSDWPQNSTDCRISRIVTTFENSLKRVTACKPKEWKKVWQSLAKKKLLPYYPHKNNSDRKQKRFQKMERALTILEESASERTVKDALRKQWMSMRFSPRIEEQVYLCEGPQNGRHNDMRMEDCRLVSFSDYAAVPPSGVWVTRLAAAGFFCPDQDSSVLRCAFCRVEVEINSFRHKLPMEVHRSLSPACPMVKGEAANTSMEEQRQKRGLQYTEAFFAFTADAVHQEKETPSPDHGGRQELRGPAVQFNGAASPQLMSSAGHLPQPGSQSRPSPHLTPAAMSSSHEARRGGHRQGSGSPQHQSSASTNASGAQSAAFTATPSLPTPPGARQQSARQQTLPPTHPTGQTSPQSSSPSPAQQHTQSGGPPHTSHRALGQHESHSERSRETVPFQTARHVDTDGERSQPNASPNTDAATPSSAAAAAAAAASEQSSPSPSTNESVRQLVTYTQLGIYTQEPKRPEMAIAGARVSSFSNWPHCSSHPAEDMAEAGFYYVGVEDLVRCFYCKGGLKSWSRSLRPWVEHARFYPQCPFVGQVKGQEFIEVVQEMNTRHKGEISNAQVDQELQKRQLAESEQGGPSGQGASAGHKVTEGTLLGAAGADEAKAKVYPFALAGAKGDASVEDEAQLEKDADKLENENVEIKNERICKICQVEEVSILFLPCGHLVSCSQCAPALRTCAVCRQKVKGRVRVLADKAAAWPKEGDNCGDQTPSTSTLSGQ